MIYIAKINLFIGKLAIIVSLFSTTIAYEMSRSQTGMMPSPPAPRTEDTDIEKQEWLESIQEVLDREGPQRAKELLREIENHLFRAGVTRDQAQLNTPYCNTIDVKDQPVYPGDIQIEERIENIIRWNAMAMVLRAQDVGSGVGGHIATYASTATMLEVGFNHFFRPRSDDYGGDLVNIQPHASPGVYARAFLEGRLNETHLENYRRELRPGGGLSSYPHPRLMPEFWQVPSASMGLSTPVSIYQARFVKYLENRGLMAASGGKIWTFIGDGEVDEPEVIGTINMATRENLDNLILVVNCNLQRLDGPVRGNGKIIQEIERSFRGAGWNVIKVIWGGGWDVLFARDHNGVLQARMDRAVDGDYQWYSVASGQEVRAHWEENNPELIELMKTLTDEEVRVIHRGGHDQRKIFAAFDWARKSTGPTVILVKTIKGYGMGRLAEGKNTAHQKKQMSVEERIEVGKRLGIPLRDEEMARATFYRPPPGSEEMQYLHARRQELGGYLPARKVQCPRLKAPSHESFASLCSGSGKRAMSTTMAMVRILSQLLKNEDIGRYIVPIVPDEARTFGMEGLFPRFGIYSPVGQQYQPVDGQTLLAYRESKDGQILQEGVCEAGAMASFLAAGSAYAVHDIPTIPFYVFYSMFGFQRVGDMIWTCGDMLCRGFLLGGTAGRTTLNGEGLQHQDGHSQLVAGTVPNLMSYDPAFAYELAIIVRDGIYRMFERQDDIFYYVTIYNENYPMPSMPDGVKEGILKGIYRFKRASGDGVKAHLFGSGSIMTQVLTAQKKLADYGVAADVWSVTSYNQLSRDALQVERWNMLHPQEQSRVSYLAEQLGGEEGVFVAASDYLKALPNSIARWVPGNYVTLGTDGYGLSESRKDLRTHFEVSDAYVTYAALQALAKEGKIDVQVLRQATEDLGIDANKPDPVMR